MKAYFDSTTGELLAAHDNPSLAPQGAVAVPLRPGGELAARMVNEMRRFRMVGGIVQEQSGWQTLDMLPDARWFAIQRLDAAYLVKMSGSYTVDDATSIPLAAAQALANFLPMAPVMIGANRGAETVGADVPGGRIVLTWQQIAEHAAAFTLAVADVQSWYQAKRTEIEASDDPASVTL
jgi:hypothetical protein